MNERDAERLAPVQAAELTRVLDLEARWEGLKIGAGGDDTLQQLRARQAAFEAYRSAGAVYARMHPPGKMPEVVPGDAKRIVVWCGIVRAVFQRADLGDDKPSPVHVTAKARRLAERVAARMGIEPPARGEPAEGLSAAVRELDEIIAWCGSATKVAA